MFTVDILCDPPEFLAAQREGDFIRLLFDHADGLYIKGTQLNSISLTDSNGAEIPPEAIEIDGCSLVLKGRFPSVLHIAFASTPFYEVNLYNRENNPAKPFQIIVP